MRFVDQCRVKVIAGDGGNGVVAFRREKFVPFGGPSGGDGGRGGDVIFAGDEGLSTLLDFTHVRTIQAARGEHGQGSDCHGRGGKDRVERVPVGTQIRDAETRELLADVTAHGQEVIVAHGGRGGRGNIHFATPHDRAPRRAEKGEPGELRELELELKIMADVGLLGFPNVGKSTFVSTVSAARPKIADYPFTTLTPTLGVVEIGGGKRAGGSTFVIADIPGLIPGASEGVGLGIRFLKHVERTRALLHLVTLDAGDGRDPVGDYRALRKELETYSPELSERPEIVALSKGDVTEVREAYPALKERFAKVGVELHLVSAATREGVAELVREMYRIVTGGATEGDLPGERKKKIAAAKKKAKKTATRKTATATKKKTATATKKKTATAKKATSKKATAKKATAKKATAKKAAPKKKVVAKKKTAPKAKKRAVAKKRPVVRQGTTRVKKSAKTKVKARKRGR